MRIPTYEEACKAVKDGSASPLDIFIADNEPAGIVYEKKFREQLKKLVNWARLQGAMDEYQDRNDD